MLNEIGQAYYDGLKKAAENNPRKCVTGQIDDLEVAAYHFQKSFEDRDVQHTYLYHKKLVLESVTYIPGSFTGQVYKEYRRRCQIADLKPRTSRRVTQLLAELEEEGLVEGIPANLGRHGRTKVWELVEPCSLPGG